MPKPTLTQLFGPGATVANQKLTIDFADFAATGWTSATGITDPEKWFAALLLRAKGWYDTNSDQQPNIAIADPFPGLTTREGTLKREYSYQVAIYEPDAGSARPDPDNV